MKGAAPPCRPGDPVLCGDTLQPEGSVGGGQHRMDQPLTCLVGLSDLFHQCP